MTASVQTSLSFLTSNTDNTDRRYRARFRNVEHNFKATVVDLDNVEHDFYLTAHHEWEASTIAENKAWVMGLQVSHIMIYPLD